MFCVFLTRDSSNSDNAAGALAPTETTPGFDPRAVAGGPPWVFSSMLRSISDNEDVPELGTETERSILEKTQGGPPATDRCLAFIGRLGSSSGATDRLGLFNNGSFEGIQLRRSGRNRDYAGL